MRVSSEPTAGLRQARSSSQKGQEPWTGLTKGQRSLIKLQLFTKPPPCDGQSTLSYRISIGSTPTKPVRTGLTGLPFALSFHN